MSEDLSKNDGTFNKIWRALLSQKTPESMSYAKLLLALQYICQENILYEEYTGSFLFFHINFIDFLII